VNDFLGLVEKWKIESSGARLGIGLDGDAGYGIGTAGGEGHGCRVRAGGVVD
jgi:hypothetical protein